MSFYKYFMEGCNGIITMMKTKINAFLGQNTKFQYQYDAYTG